MLTHTSVAHLVVIGASAGDLDALTTLIATLPADFPAPIVLASSLDAHSPSHLAEMLGRFSTLPVRMVGAQEPLIPGVVSVVPANRQVEISDAAIMLHEEPVGRFPTPLDRMLTNAAAVYGERLIAVILSGAAPDGAVGACAVKKAAGTVIIPAPQTPPTPGKPFSLAPTTVDLVAPLERLGAMLRALIAGVPMLTQPEEQKALQEVLEALRERAGLDFTVDTIPTLGRRMHRRIIATATESLDGYRQYLETHPDEYPHLIQALMSHVSEFFQDPDLVAYLRTEVLPEVVKYARLHGDQVRIWLVGCATGEEAYMLAILLSEVLGRELEAFTVRLFATDVDPQAIAFARQGVYPRAALTGMPEAVIGRYFTPDNGFCRITPHVRSLIVFSEHDLEQRAPFAHLDLLMCRKGLRYFTAARHQRTLQRFASALRDGGYLVLGNADSPTPLAAWFALENQQFQVYRRQGERLLLPPGPVVHVALAPTSRLTRPRLLPSEIAARQRQNERLQRMRRTKECVLQHLPVGVVVVDYRYDIQVINSAARRYLSIHSATVGEDLLHLTPAATVERLRTAIRRAFRTGAATSIDEFPIEGPTTGEPLYLQVLCYPQRSEGEGGPIETVLVVFTEITALIQRQQALEAKLHETTTDLARHQRERAEEETKRDAQMRAALEQARRQSAVEFERLQRERAEERIRLEHQIQRLGQANQQLMEANQDLTSTNEELGDTTAELLLRAEEAQAATEEVESLNEELLATNEELETLNEELQLANEELNTTQADLHARNLELQELTRASEEKRTWLETILLSKDDAVMVLNSTGELLLTNDAYTRLFGGPRAGIVARDEHGYMLPSEATPHERAMRGESFRMEFTVAAEDGSRRWFEAQGQPMQSQEGATQGGVVVIRAMTERA